MRKPLLLLIILSFLFVGCKNSDHGNSDKQTTRSKKKKSKKTRALSSSSGTINSLTIVMDDAYWDGSLGENLREQLTAPVKGLPQEEPLFSLNHIPPKAFSGFTRTSRNILKVDKSAEPYFEIVRDTFAKPQTGIFVGGKDSAEIEQLIKDNMQKLISTIKRTERVANQKRFSKSLLNTDVLKNTFGLDMRIPSVYRYAKEKDDFVWLRKDIKQGSMEILIYEVPMDIIDKDTSVVSNVIEMRDSIGKKYIPGPDEGSFMTTEKAYAPYLFEIKLNNKFTYLTKGTWEVKDAFMAGPFVNYAVRDEANDRYLVLEGFVFKPQAPTKRNNIFELESIFSSAKILAGK